MKQFLEKCAGIDVGKREIAVTLLTGPLIPCGMSMQHRYRKRAVIASARSLSAVVWIMLSRSEPCREATSDFRPHGHSRKYVTIDANWRNWAPMSPP